MGGKPRAAGAPGEERRRLEKLLRAAGAVTKARQVVPEVRGAPPPRAAADGEGPGLEALHRASELAGGPKGQGRGAKRGRPRRRDEGQVLILAGAVLVLALLVAAFAVTELASQEQQLEQGATSDLPQLFPEARDEFAAAMSSYAIPSISNETLLEAFRAQRLEYEERGRGHGLFVAVSLANITDPYAPKSEKADYTQDDAGAASCGGAPEVKRKYTVWSHNGSRDYTSKSWDCGDDGILWDRDTQQIKGIIVYFFMASETARLEDVVVIALN